eukprot:m.3542 g.3542  ORF g.3542 m.3542 type:complete len:630 (-) comp2084_c0_seq1:187-2076(-)
MGDRPPPPAFKPPKKTVHEDEEESMEHGDGNEKSSSLKPKPSRRRRHFKSNDDDDEEGAEDTATPTPEQPSGTETLNSDEIEKEVYEDAEEREKEVTHPPSIPSRPTKRPPPPTTMRPPPPHAKDHVKTPQEQTNVVRSKPEEVIHEEEATPPIPTRPQRTAPPVAKSRHKLEGKDDDHDQTKHETLLDGDGDGDSSGHSPTPKPKPKTRPMSVKRPPPPKASSTHSSTKASRPARPAPMPKRPAPPPGGKKEIPHKPGRPTASSHAKSPAKKPTTKPPTLPPRPGPGHPLYHYMVVGPRASILFDWSGGNEGDLAVKSGDIVKILEWRSLEWIYGDNAGTKGIFPVVYADILEDISITGPRAVADYLFEGQFAHELTFDVGNEIQLLGVINDEWMRGRYHGEEGAFPTNFVEIIEPLPTTTHEGWPAEWKKAIDAAKTQSDDAATLHAPTPHEDEIIDITHYGYEREKMLGPIHEDTTDTSVSLSADAFGNAHALYDYDTQTDGDLSFREGDTIILTERVGEEWLRGFVSTHQGHEGIFPSSFVEVLKEPSPAEESNDPEAHEPEEKEKIVGMATSLTTWDGESVDDAPVKEGEKIQVLKKLDEEWLFVRNSSGKEGMIPASFVEMVV